jgi:hypothetical protein
VRKSEKKKKKNEWNKLKNKHIALYQLIDTNMIDFVYFPCRCYCLEHWNILQQIDQSNLCDSFLLNFAFLHRHTAFEVVVSPACLFRLLTDGRLISIIGELFLLVSICYYSPIGRIRIQIDQTSIEHTSRCLFTSDRLHWSSLIDDDRFNMFDNRVICSRTTRLSKVNLNIYRNNDSWREKNKWLHFREAY